MVGEKNSILPLERFITIALSFSIWNFFSVKRVPINLFKVPTKANISINTTLYITYYTELCLALLLFFWKYIEHSGISNLSHLCYGFLCETILKP